MRADPHLQLDKFVRTHFQASKVIGVKDIICRFQFQTYSKILEIKLMTINKDLSCLEIL
jgi:hypothetical protein